MRAGAKPDERGDVLRLRVAAVLGLLGRSGLAGELVAGHLDLGGGAARPPGRPRASSAAARRSLAEDPGALGVALDLLAAELRDQPRLAERPAVGDRRVGRGHLQRGDREALADRQVAHARAGVLVDGRDDPPLLARVVDPGRLAEAELPDPRVEGLGAEVEADRDRADVRGLGEDLGDRRRRSAGARAPPRSSRSATLIVEGRWKLVSGVTWPSSSAAPTVKALKVEPGS